MKKLILTAALLAFASPLQARTILFNQNSAKVRAAREAAAKESRSR